MFDEKYNIFMDKYIKIITLKKIFSININSVIRP